jgi:hypothetical protein
MASKRIDSYISSTLKFCLAGIFTPVMTMYVIVGIQFGLEKLGLECTVIWTILWTLTTSIALVAPFVFVRLMNKRLGTGYNFGTDKLIVFNFIELACIQCVLGSRFTTAQILCYGNGGQNGLEFIFTGWLSLPFLALFSIVFDNLRKKKIVEIKAKAQDN